MGLSVHSDVSPNGSIAAPVLADVRTTDSATVTMPADASRADITAFVPGDAEATGTTAAFPPAGALPADITVLSAHSNVPSNGSAVVPGPADLRLIDSAAVSAGNGVTATPTSADVPPKDAGTGSVLPGDGTAGDAARVPANGRMAGVAALPRAEGARTGCAVGDAADGRAESGVSARRGGDAEVVPVDGRRDGNGGGDGGPGLLGMLAGAAVRTVTHPVTAVRSVVRAAGDLDAIPLVGGVPGAKLIAKAVRMVSGERHDRPEMPRLTAPRTPFNGPISGRRHLSFGSLSLKDVKKVAKANGISVNDVVMTLCTSALRSWLRERDALPEAPLVVAVPVAVRTGAAKDVVGNQISAMVAPLPTNVDDPGERLQAVGDAMARAKRRFALSPATWPSELCSMLPAPVTSLATPAIFRLAGVAFPPINLIISNVPGPQFPLYLCGGRLLSYYPLSVVTDLSGGLSITCFSYDGMIDFGLVACPERVDDVWSLVDHLRTALDELLDERVGDEFRDGLGIDLVAG
ncbi:WS/DGAT domain-containing protein [Nonomuraea aridisoli]|nr:WS/DGAT domain-containing protein [Nonomuraea aridisoli]